MRRSGAHARMRRSPGDSICDDPRCVPACVVVLATPPPWCPCARRQHGRIRNLLRRAGNSPIPKPSCHLVDSSQVFMQCFQPLGSVGPSVGMRRASGRLFPGPPFAVLLTLRSVVAPHLWPTTTTPCPTTTTPCSTSTTPCPTTTTPCATTTAGPCDTTANFIAKYAVEGPCDTTTPCPTTTTPCVTTSTPCPTTTTPCPTTTTPCPTTTT